MKNSNSSSKITQQHLSKSVYVYIRQSTLHQVLNNRESTSRQYELAERAVSLGWAKPQIYLIDEDLAKSGARFDMRQGFQKLLAEISLGRVGLVISLEAARLSRNCSDWYKLLELCSIFGTLIADCELVYDPRLYHDRLLLGLAGMMSEAELHHIRMRMYEGQRHKAGRGELRLQLPVGLERLRSGEIILHPDEEIQARLRLVFSKFDELGSARAVVKYLRKYQFTIPTRPRLGPEPYEIVWVQPKIRSVYHILKNPAYAGAYVYGKTKTEPTRRRQGVPNSGLVRLPMEQWEVCIKDIYPAYISWQQFITNQQKFKANQYAYKQGQIGAARNGQVLLQGIALCGKCGARMWARYRNYPSYICNDSARELGEPRCQEVKVLEVDAFVEQQILQALEPDKLTVALAAFEQLEKRDVVVKEQWLLKIQRAKYEATRAQRQYNCVDPENRLVARNLEKHWETKLREAENIEKEYENWAQQRLTTLSTENQQQLLALGENLPKIWYANTTTNADRKRIARLVIKEVIMDKNRQKGKIWLQINWQTGATTQHWINYRPTRYDQVVETDALKQRIIELRNEGKRDLDIVRGLNSEGYKALKGGKITHNTVLKLRQHWQIDSPKQERKKIVGHQWEDGSYTLQGVACVVGVHLRTVHVWLKNGMLDAYQPFKYSPWKISLTEEKIAQLKEYLSDTRILPKNVRGAKRGIYKDDYQNSDHSK